MEEGKKGKEIFTKKLKMNRRNAHRLLKNWAFWPYHRQSGSYPKTGVMSGWATTHPEHRLIAPG
jgi:hypothetical protein